MDNGTSPTSQNGQIAAVQTEQPKRQKNGKVPKEKEESSATLDGWTEEEITNWRPNEYEKDLVRRTWSDDFDFLFELGSAIYTYIFEHNPQAKVLFPKIHQHGDAWRESADFRSQALKFVQTISYAAKNLYHMEECLEPRLFQIGQNHVKYAARGFKPEFWDIFLDAMECSLTAHIRSIANFSEQQRTDATRIWRQLAHYIIVHMKRGYQAEEKKAKKGKKH